MMKGIYHIIKCLSSYQLLLSWILLMMFEEDGGDQNRMDFQCSSHGVVLKPTINGNPLI